MAQERETDWNPLLFRDLEDYREGVELFASEDKDISFPNDGNEKALIVFETIFKFARERVDIAAGSLCNEFTGDQRYINAVEEFLNKPKSELRILVNSWNQEDMEQSSFFKNLKGKSNVTVKRSEEKFFAKDEENEQKQLHFCVGDDKMYRLEYDIAKRKAICNFNNPEIVQTLRKVFDKIFPKGALVDLSTISFAY